MSTTQEASASPCAQIEKAPHGSSEDHLDSTMLHRCCIQVSSSLKKEKISLDAEKKLLFPFVLAHAATYTHEVARALIWRVVDTLEEDLLDRAGAWELLQEVLEWCDKEESLAKTSLAQKISSFLPDLIAHRWFTRAPRQADGVLKTSSDTPQESVEKRESSGKDIGSLTKKGSQEFAERDGDEDGKEYTNDRMEKVHRTSSRTTAEPWKAVLMEGPHRKVVPAAMVNGPAGYSQVPVNPAELEELASRYSHILSGWKKIWRVDIYHELKAAVRRVVREGNYLSAKSAVLFDIPNRFRDSLWRLRRRTPRPSITYHLLYVYGWEAKRDKRQTSNFYRNFLKTSYAIPTTLEEARSALDPHMHPIAWSWIRRLVEEKGGCLLCDTWRHQQLRCPCEQPFQHPLLHAEAGGSKGEQGAEASAGVLTRYVGRGGSGLYNEIECRLEKMSYVDAVEILRRHGLHLPLRAENVLNTVVKLIIEEKASTSDEVLLAFDRFRGSITGPLERHALWIHASYKLFPGKTVLDRPSDDQLSPALERAEKELLSQRRYREWDQFLESVEVLDGVFKRGLVPTITNDAIGSIRHYASFFFCLVDGSLPASFTPGRYARVPDEVLLVASMKDVLCGSCLEPFHRTSTCPKCAPQTGGEEPFHRPREQWDLRVARQLLDSFHLLDIRLPEEERKVQEAMETIAHDGRPATKFRQDELSLAVKLVHERRSPYCWHCNMMGHSGRRCEWAAYRTLVKEYLPLMDCRLDPSKIRRRIEDYKDRTRRLRLLSESRHAVNRKELENAEMEERQLKEAYELLVAPYLYPSRFLSAMKELSSAFIPLTAARYCTNAVQGFLLSINSSDLLEQLPVLREESFPEVCVYCDSIHHQSENCPSENAQSMGEEVHFLKELRERGLTFWEYMRRRDFYEDRLPTNYMEGRDSLIGLIRQFEEDFNPGGVGRENFLKQNDLVLLTNATGAAILTTREVMSQEKELHSSSAAIDSSQPEGKALLSSQDSVPSSTPMSQFTVTSLYGRSGFSQLRKEHSCASTALSSITVDDVKKTSIDDPHELDDQPHRLAAKRPREEDDELLGGSPAYSGETGDREDTTLTADGNGRNENIVASTTVASEA